LSRPVALSSGTELLVEIRHTSVFHVTALMVRMEVSRSLLGSQPRPVHARVYKTNVILYQMHAKQLGK
jgi:hypothetical protein